MEYIDPRYLNPAYAATHPIPAGSPIVGATHPIAAGSPVIPGTGMYPQVPTISPQQPPTAYQPTGYSAGGFPNPNRPLPAPVNLPAPQYLPQVLGDQTLPQYMQLPQYRKMIIPTMTGNMFLSITPERLNSIVGMTQQELAREQQFNQQNFNNRGQMLQTGMQLDTNALNTAMAPIEARNKQMQTATAELNYQTGWTDSDKARHQERLLGMQHQLALQLQEAKQRHDKGLEIAKLGLGHAFNNAEATVKRWLSTMSPEDMALLKQNAVTGGDIGMLLSNPNFTARTKATDMALIGALELFKQSGVHPFFLIGGNEMPGTVVPQTPTASTPQEIPRRTVGTTLNEDEDEVANQFRLWKRQ